MNHKLCSRIGLALRAGKLISGEEGVLKSVRGNEAKLVIMSLDASENTKKKFRDKCSSYQVPLIEIMDRYALGQCTGKQERVLIAITDGGFARMIMESAK